MNLVSLAAMSAISPQERQIAWIAHPVFGTLKAKTSVMILSTVEAMEKGLIKIRLQIGAKIVNQTVPTAPIVLIA